MTNKQKPDSAETVANESKGTPLHSVNEEITITIEHYHDNGRLFSLAIADADGIKNGIYTEWYEDGRIAHSANYINNKIEGLAYSFDENGKLSCIDYFTDGKSVSTEYYENGIIVDIE